MGKHVGVTIEPDSADLLRERGLRVTPQRRAILGAFARGAAEHLSADEVHARAAAAVPGLGRGTVYAALAELTELGILCARGNPEPVRYETNTEPHQHFRCRLCLRLFDVALAGPDAGRLEDEGFVVEQVAVTVEGICAECVGYEAGLRTGAQAARTQPSPELPADLAVTAVDTPAGRLTLGATPQGMVRAVFDNHADADPLQESARRRRGSRAAREHLAAARAAIAEFIAGRPALECPIDWDRLEGAETLRAAQSTPRAQSISYELLDTTATASERGRVLGANPLAILVPCHRVTRGREIPAEYVGGAERRRALRELEGV
jgi:Fur family transcriptional regulator, stress-responsive regulator